MASARFSIKVDPVGFGQVTVNGEDVTDRTQGFRVESAQGQPSFLTLYTSGQGTIQGEGVVQVVEYHEDEAAVIKDFLKKLDAKVIEKIALERTGWGSASLVGEVFAVLANIADGKAP